MYVGFMAVRALDLGLKQGLINAQSPVGFMEMKLPVSAWSAA
jgi:hypothetical protein